MLVLLSCLEWFQFRSGFLNLQLLIFWELDHLLLWGAVLDTGDAWPHPCSRPIRC